MTEPDQPLAASRWQRLQALATDKFNVDVLWNLASLVILAASGVLMNGLIVVLRDETALGVFNQVFALYIICSQFGVGGVQYSVLHYISHNPGDAPLVADIGASALLLIVLLSTPLMLLVWWAAPTLGGWLNSPAVAEGIRYAVPGLLFFALNKALINILNGLQRMRAYAVFRAVRFLLLPLLIVVFILLGYSDPLLALTLTLTEMVLFVLLLVYIYGYARLLPLRRVAQLRHWLGKHLSYGTRGFLSGVLGEANTRVDVLMLGLFTTDAMVGVYSFAATLAEGFIQLPEAVRYNVDPIVGGHFARNDPEAIRHFARRVQRLFIPLMLGLGVLAIALYPLLLALLALLAQSTDLAASWGVFIILALAVVISSSYRPFRGLFLQGGRPGLHTALTALVVGSNILLNALLIPILGIYGAALATGLALLLDVLLLLVFSRRIWGLRL